MQGKAWILLVQDKIDEINQMTSAPTAAPGSANQTIQELTRTSSGWGSFLQLVGLVFLLIIILIATYYTTRLVGGIKQNQLKNSNFKVIDAWRISPNKAVQIVKIGDKYIVLGIGKDTINYITELDEAEVLIRENNASEKLSFRQILEKLRNKQ